NFSAKHMLASGFMQNFLMQIQQLIAKEPKEFTEGLNQLVKKEQDFLVANGKGLPQSFIEFWDAQYTYYKYLAMLMYAPRHEMMKKQTMDIGEIPAEYLAVTKQVPEKFDDKLMYVDGYRNYIREFYIYKLMAEGVKPEPGENKFMVDKALELTRKNMPPL